MREKRSDGAVRVAARGVEGRGEDPLVLRGQRDDHLPILRPMHAYEFSFRLSFSKIIT